MEEEEKCPVCGKGLYEGEEHDECSDMDCECFGEMVDCDHEHTNE